jgi:hypothetical protein
MKNLITKILGKICVWWALRISKKNWSNPYAQTEYQYFVEFCNFTIKQH